MSVSNDETIRKQVGEAPSEKRPLQRAWELRERVRRLGIDIEKGKDERIRKVVARPEPRRG